MTVALRPYQEDLLQRIREAMRSHRRVVAVMPTGAGKGQTIGAIVRSATAKGRRVLVVAHRRRLIRQLRQTIAGWGVSDGVTVESVQTVILRLDSMDAPDLIVIDEAHHLTHGNMWGKIVNQWPDAFLLGKTATPERLDGKGLGEGYGGYFQALVQGPTSRWLTDNGFLARARVFCPPVKIDRSKLKVVAGDYAIGTMEDELENGNVYGDAVEHYMKLVHPGTALVACVSVKHAKMAADEYEAAGVPAAAITQGCSEDDQERIFQQLADGTLKVVTYCDMLSEGVDVPSVKACQLLRPTKSLVMYLQQVGRALRVKPDGGDAIILDHVGNVKQHGLPTDDREWDLKGRPKRPAAPMVKVCPECFATMAAQLAVCEECGHEFGGKAKNKEAEVIDGDLVEVQERGSYGRLGVGVYIDIWFGQAWKEGYVIAAYPKTGPITVQRASLTGPKWQVRRDHVRFHGLDDLPTADTGAAVASARKREQAKAQTLEDLIAVGQRRGMKNPRGWARHVLAARQTKGRFERVVA